MSYYIDVFSDSINKYGEELCGDNVEIVSTEKGVIVVLADGLGSGVKANILATMTTKIAATMMKNGATIYETVDTIVHTLPVCSVRKLAYSTFTIVEINRDGTVYIAEYDNPPYFLINKNKDVKIERYTSIVRDKVVLESKFKLEADDYLVLVSDGIVHAGIEGLLRLGWQWNNVNLFLNFLSKKEPCAKCLVSDTLNICKKLYSNKPGDDSTIVAIKIKECKYINIFTGPPKDKNKDKFAVEEFMKANGKKIVCGGTTAKIVERELNGKLEIDLSTLTEDIPPIGKMEGIDLVTEGVLTLSKVIDNLKKYIKYSSYNKKEKLDWYFKTDAASILTKNLINECTHLNLFVGKAVNPAHQNPNLPVDLSVKLNLIDELIVLMKKLRKIVTITYFD